MKNEENQNDKASSSQAFTRRFLLKSAAAAAGAAAMTRYSGSAALAAPLKSTLTQIPSAAMPPVPADLVKTAAVRKAIPFDMGEVRLLPGLFRDAQMRDEAYLLFLQPDRLLHGFFINAGLPTKGDSYGGWEQAGVAGHIGGHYLSACSAMYRVTGNPAPRERVDYMVGQLAQCQQKSPDGFVSAIPDGRNIFAKIAANGTVTGWVPWYTMHKLYAGLRDAYYLCGNSQAKDVFLKLNDWAIGITSGLTDAEFQSMLGTEHGGMAEITADAYAMTADPKYLALAHRFTHHAVFDPLAAHKDELDGLHSNTQIPKMIGYERIAKLTGEDAYHQAPLFFWETVSRNRSFANGGNGNYEHFFPVNDFSGNCSTDNETETCCSYNMLKLTDAEFQINPSPEAGDFYERTVLNHILASQEHSQGLMIYHTPMKPGHFKVYGDPVNAMWCCTGTGMENHARYGEAIYYHTPDNHGLYISQYFPSVLNWREKGIVLRQETRFPEEETTRLKFSCVHPTTLALKLRCPAWCKGMTISINGKPMPVATHPGTYVNIEREWRSGDILEARLPMAVHMDPLPNAPLKQAVMYGPTLLVSPMGTADMEKTPDIATNQAPYGNLPALEIATLISRPTELTERIKRVPNAAQPLTFQTQGLGKPNDVTLVPLYAVNHERYNFYWDVYTPEAYAQAQGAMVAQAAVQKALDLRTVDQFLPGNQQSEVDHHLQSTNSNTGNFNGIGWRDASTGGSFSFTLQVDPTEPMDLQCEYWGSDNGGRVFDVLVDGTLVGTTTLNSNQPGKMFYVDYAVPQSLTAGKQTVTVKLQAHPGMMAGGLFGCRMLRQAK